MAQSPITPGTWYHLVGTYDGNTISLYQNGALLGSTSPGSGKNTGNSANVSIGKRTGDGTGFWNGLIEEVRISNVARSADWIAAEYANQSSPSTFETVGAEQ